MIIKLFPPCLPITGLEIEDWAKHSSKFLKSGMENLELPMKFSKAAIIYLIRNNAFMSVSQTGLLVHGFIPLLRN